MIRKAFSIIVISLLLCIVCQVSYARDSGSSVATVHGYVINVNSQTVPGATVNLHGEGTSPATAAMTTKTDTRGYYVFNGIPPGNYSIDASRDYYVYTTTASIGEGDHPLNLTMPLPRTAMAE